MFTSIIGRTFRLAFRSWARTIGAYLLASILAGVFLVVVLLVGRALLGGSLEAITGGDTTDADAGRLLIFGLPLFLVALASYAWPPLVAIRAVSGDHSIGDSLRGAVPGAWRFVPLMALWLGLVGLLVVADPTGGIVALVVLLLMSVPWIALTGEVALEPGRWGLRTMWSCGIARMHRNVGAYLAVVFVLLVTLLVGGALYLGPIVAIAGAPPGDAMRDAAAFEDWATDAVLGMVVGSILSLVATITLPNALVVAVYEQLTGAVDHTRWEDDDAPYRPTSELSPAVQQLVGASSAPTRRMVLPPRAAEPGRVPGPGVLTVAGVDLPVGRATRSVEAATLELAVGDGAPGPGSHDEQLWISREALPAIPALWKQLAAGFAETGLWPLAVPVAADGAPVEWIEHATRREPDSLEDGESIADRLRLRLSESLDGGTPLRSTDLLRQSHTARGELMCGQGRRTDALTFAFGEVGTARLALAPARRPGDVLHALAWPGAAAAGVPTDELAEIVASWEERYAALLVGLGEATVWFAVLRPPSTLDEAVEVVAEHHALCPDEAAGWGDDLSHAEQLVDAPVWRLTWH